jgi:hypothetical protein
MHDCISLRAKKEGDDLCLAGIRNTTVLDISSFEDHFRYKMVYIHVLLKPSIS